MGIIQWTLKPIDSVGKNESLPFNVLLAALNLVLYIGEIVIFVGPTYFFYYVVNAFLQTHEIDKLLFEFHHFDFELWIVDLLFDKFSNKLKAKFFLIFLWILAIGYIPEFHFASEGLWKGSDRVNPSVCGEAFLFKAFEDGTHPTDFMRVDFFQEFGKFVTFSKLFNFFIYFFKLLNMVVYNITGFLWCCLGLWNSCLLGFDASSHVHVHYGEVLESFSDGYFLVGIWFQAHVVCL